MAYFLVCIKRFQTLYGRVSIISSLVSVLYYDSVRYKEHQPLSNSSLMETIIVVSIYAILVRVGVRLALVKP